MLNENEYFTSGAGVCFKKAAGAIRRGENTSFVVPEILNGLRKEINEHGAPVALLSLAVRAGVIPSPDCLPLGAVSADERETCLDQHLHDGRVHDRAPQAAREVAVIRRVCQQQQEPLPGSRGLAGLLEDWCLECVGEKLLGPIEPSLQGTPEERRAKIEALLEGVQGRLQSSDSDIIVSMAEGQPVRERSRVARRTTAEMLHAPVAVLGQEPP